MTAPQQSNHPQQPPAGYSAPATGQTGPPQGYAPSDQQPAPIQYQQQPVPQPAQPPTAPLNMFGIIALGIVVLSSVLPLVTPFLYQSAFRASDAGGASIGAVTTIITLINGALILVTIALGIVGALQRQTRARWTAVAALGAAGSGAVSMIASLIGNLFSGLLYG